MSGSCGVFKQPAYAVNATTRYGKQWVSGTIEAGIGACNWERPKAEPKAAPPPSAKRSAGTVRPIVTKASQKQVVAPPSSYEAIKRHLPLGNPYTAPAQAVEPLTEEVPVVPVPTTTITKKQAEQEVKARKRGCENRVCDWLRGKKAE